MQDLSYRSALAVTALPTPSASLKGVTVRLTTDDKPYWCNGTTWVDLTEAGTAALKANNLSDLASIPTALVNLGLNNVSNTSDANKPISTATQTALNAKESTANKGMSNGYAALDATGKVPSAQLPAASGGDFVKVQTITVAAGAAYVDITLDPAVYRSMLLAVYDLYGSTSGGFLAVQFLGSGGTPYTYAHYKYSYSSAGSTSLSSASTQTAVTLPTGWGISSSFKLTAEIKTAISTVNNHNARLSWESSDKWNDRDTMGVASIHGSWSNVTGLRLFPSAGTFTAGTIIVYGVKK